MKERLAQLRQAWQFASEQDPRLPLLVFGPAGGVLVAGVVAGIVLASWFWYVVGVLLAATVALVIFGRRAQAAQFSAIEGRPGAAAAVLNTMRGQWFVSPGVAFNRKQDLVHRVVGRCGIVLVGEGNRAGVRQLLTRERKRLGRIAGDVTIHTVVVGNGEGETELSKLPVAMTKLPNELKKNEVPRLERRLKPMDREAPMPKGYIPNPGKKMR